jgi:hypothetical protein
LGTEKSNVHTIASLFEDMNGWMSLMRHVRRRALHARNMPRLLDEVGRIAFAIFVVQRPVQPLTAVTPNKVAVEGSKPNVVPTTCPPAYKKTDAIANEASHRNER